MKQDRIELMEKTPVKTAILKLAMPTMLAMTIQLIYNLTDMFFIGKTGDPNLVAAVSIVTPIFLGIQAIGNIFAIGASSYISIKLGEKDKLEARRANSVAFYSSLGVGIFIMAILLTLRHPLLSNIGTSDITIGPTFKYFTIISATAAIFIVQVALSGLVRSEGATDEAMIGMVIGVGLNIVLDPVFIFVLNMGIAGAAWATVIGNTIGALYYIRHFFTKKTFLSIKLKDFRPSRKIYMGTLKIGIPAAMSMIIMSISMIFVNIIASGYGDYVVAGCGVQMRIVSVCFVLIMGLAQGYQPFAGFNYGAKNWSRLISGFKITIIYSSILTVFFTILFSFTAKILIRLFVNDAATIEVGAKMLRAFLWGMPIIGIQVTMMVTFQATGKALKALIVSLGRQCLIYFPLLFILNYLFGFNGFIFAQPVADIATTVIAIMLSLSFLKEIHAKRFSDVDKKDTLEKFKNEEDMPAFLEYSPVESKE